MLPYSFSRWAIDRVSRVEERPAVFYFHPWEIDADQPRVEGAPLRVCVSDAADASLRAAAAYSLLINIPSALLGMSLADVQARSPRRASEQIPWRIGDTDLEIFFDRSNASNPRKRADPILPRHIRRLCRWIGAAGRRPCRRRR